jgi:protein TonB
LHQAASAPHADTIQFLTPPTIRTQIATNTAPDGPPTTGAPGMGDDSSIPGGTTDVFRGHTTPPNIHPDVRAPIRVPSSIEAAMILQKTLPIYPAIAKAAGVQGTVILAATISKAGTIENLRVMGGPVMLQRAALDAVETWRYKPYLLDGQPVEVETSISVIFTMQR